MARKTQLQEAVTTNKLAIWSANIADCKNSGLSVAAWCESHNVPKSTYYNWQQKVYEALCVKEPSFVEMPVEPVAMPATNAAVASISINETKVEIYAGADETTIFALVRALKSC